MTQLDSIVTDLFRTYRRQPDRIEQLLTGHRGDGTFRRIDSLCVRQHELLLRMAACCPRGLNRHLVSRVEQHCDLRHAAEAAEAAKAPPGYRESCDSTMKTR